MKELLHPNLFKIVVFLVLIPVFLIPYTVLKPFFLIVLYLPFMILSLLRIDIHGSGYDLFYFLIADWLMYGTLTVLCYYVACSLEHPVKKHSALNGLLLFIALLLIVFGTFAQIWQFNPYLVEEGKWLQQNFGYSIIGGACYLIAIFLIYFAYRRGINRLYLVISVTIITLMMGSLAISALSTYTPKPEHSFEPTIIQSPITDTIYCCNQSVILRASGSTEITEYVWNSDRNGTLGTGESIDVNVSNLTEGWHTITLTATGNTGKRDTYSIRIQVYRRMPELPPLLSIAPTDFDLQLSKDSQQDTMKMISIRNDGDGTLEWTAKTNQNWVYLTMLSGRAPTEISFLVDTEKLLPGVHKAEILFSPKDQTLEPVTVSIRVCLRETQTANVDCPNI